MDPLQALRDGDLATAISELQDQVRNSPEKPELRVFLFQLLSIMGQWHRAITQLKVAGEMDPANLAMAKTYEVALRCEVLREEVFSGKRSPLIFGDPAEWVAKLIQAVKLQAEGKSSQADALRKKALEVAPATGGTIDGSRFEWIADADSRLGPIIEAVVNGKYYWIPAHRIHKINLEPPADLRDMVWSPAHFIWANGGEAFGFIPTRYVGSQSADSTLALARKTEWQALSDTDYSGLGQRVLATDVDDYPLLEIREICLDTLEETDAPEVTPETE